MIIHRRGCHCGRVRFEVTTPAEIVVSECNCSICSKSGFLALTAPRGRFRLISGEDGLTPPTASIPASHSTSFVPTAGSNPSTFRARTLTASASTCGVPIPGPSAE